MSCLTDWNWVVKSNFSFLLHDLWLVGFLSFIKSESHYTQYSSCDARPLTRGPSYRLHPVFILLTLFGSLYLLLNFSTTKTLSSALLCLLGWYGTVVMPRQFLAYLKRHLIRRYFTKYILVITSNMTHDTMLFISFTWWEMESVSCFSWRFCLAFYLLKWVMPAPDRVMSASQSILMQKWYKEIYIPDS